MKVADPDRSSRACESKPQFRPARGARVKRTRDGYQTRIIAHTSTLVTLVVVPSTVAKKRSTRPEVK